ncbi:MAG: NUDIX domain-containing protein [Bdellovibrio sp.]|nr:NUDIX domain-containing protein [Bdellovibrio sp.]
MSSSAIEVVALALQRTSDKKFLLSRRGPGQAGAGHWEFPGGKVEKNEQRKQALVREIEEELGFLLMPENLTFVASHVFQYPEKHVDLQLFKYVSDQLDFNFILTEHDQIAWCWPSEMNQYELSPGDIFFIDKLL